MMAYVTLQEIEKLMPRNSKGYKRDLRDMRPVELKHLQRLAERVQTHLYRIMIPLEEELMHKTGKFR
jgi:hypothetical protein